MRLTQVGIPDDFAELWINISTERAIFNCTVGTTRRRGDRLTAIACNETIRFMSIINSTAAFQLSRFGRKL